MPNRPGRILFESHSDGGISPAGNNFETILLVCAGTGENQADEDVLAAGALCELIYKVGPLAPRDIVRPQGAGRARRRTLQIPHKSRYKHGWRQNRIYRRQSVIQKTRDDCWRFPNCARTWRSACSGTFFRSSPKWNPMARSGFQFESCAPSACNFARVLASSGLSRNAV